jgi:hypothetical protein
VRPVTVGRPTLAEIPCMQNRIPFLQRVMDEVHRQPPPQAREPLDGLGAEVVGTDDGQFASSGATSQHPLQLFVEVEMMRTLVADALEALRWSESRICTTPARTAAWERAVDQRRLFLAWLAAVGRRKVFLAMYPEFILESDTEEGPGEETAV